MFVKLEGWVDSAYAYVEVEKSLNMSDNVSFILSRSC